MGVYRQKGRSVWQYKFKRGGETIHGSTGETSKRKADAVFRKAKAQYDAGVVRVTAKGYTLSDLWVLEEQRINAGNFNERRLDDMLNSFRHLVDYFGADCALSKVNDYEAVQGYIAARQKDFTRFNEPTRGTTIRREKHLLSRTLKIAARQKPPWVDHVSEFPKVPDGCAGSGYQKKNPILRAKSHPREIILAVFNELREAEREHVVVDVLSLLRREELPKLSYSWLEERPGGRKVIIVPDWAAKDRDERELPVPQRVIDIIEKRYRERSQSRPTVCLVPDCGHAALHRGVCKRHNEPRSTKLYAEAEPYRLPHKSFLGVYDEDTPLFPDNQIDDALRDACRKIGYAKNVTMRDLRAWGATVGDWKTGDRKAAQDALGHTQSSTTDNYLFSSSERVATLLQAVDDYLFGDGDAKGEPNRATAEGAVGGKVDCDGDSQRVLH